MALGSRNKKAVQRLWRPDFRDVQLLPDTKVIRTGFLLNFIAIAVTLGFVTLYLFKEYSLQTISSTVATVEKQVAENTPENRSLLNTNKRFKQSAAVMEEVVAFDQQLVDYPSFVRELSSVLPAGVILETIQLRAGGGLSNNKIPPLSAELVGTISGDTSETPSQILNNFRADIAELPSVAERRLEMDLARFQRNNTDGSFSFTLEILIHVETVSE